MKNIKINNFLLLILCTISLLFIQTIAYSALSSTMKITGSAYARVDADIRVTDFSIYSVSVGALSSYEEFGKDNLASTITLPNSDSYVIYKVNITNYGNIDMGIKSINGLNDNLSYELIDYTLKDKLCDETDKCNLGSVSTFYIKIKYSNYDSSNTIYSINLNFVFEQVFNVTYDGIINSNYPVSVMKNETLNINFTTSIPKVIPYSNGEKLTNYTYTNNSLTISDVMNDINVVYKEKVYMTTLPDEQYFKETTYLTNIKKVHFVDYIDEGSHLIEWDLSENSDGTIIGWIDNSTNYNLYIGSDWNIYSKDLSYTFYNMSGVEYIYFNNLNTSECTTMYYMFNGASGLLELDVSSFDTKNVTNMARMFQGLKKITELDVKNFDTRNVTEMYGMFSNCESIINLDLNNFVTNKVKVFNSMLAYMKNLENLDISSFETKDATSMIQMFYYNERLQTLDISSFETSKVKDMERMFGHCNELTNIFVGSGWDTASVTNSTRMFADSSKLPNYDSNYIDVTKAYVGDGGYLSSNIKIMKIDGIEYEYVNGMTWKEWCDSSYNTLGLYYNNEYSPIIKTSTYMLVTDGQVWFANEQIIDGYEYNIVNQAD